MDTNVKPLQVTIPPPQATKTPGSFWEGNDAPSFQDLLDTINPLQQIPIISTLYREISGDTLSTGARMAGGTLLA